MTKKYEKLLTRSEVAEMLGVSGHTVRNYEKRGSLARIELSGVGIRYLKKDIDDFIMSRRVGRALW